MTIVSSVAKADPPQRDGRRYVFEAHTDQVGRVFPLSWLAAAGADPQSQLAAHAAEIEATSTAGEVDANIAAVILNGSLATVSLVYSTVAQNRAALRQAYLIATRTEAVMIGDFLSTLTDGQLQALFGLTAGQVTTLRTNKLTPAASLAASIRATTGA